MRELSVYYCPHCGHYAYYQLARHAVCPKCEIPMQVLDMRFQDFMNLTREERDDLLSFEILSTSCPTGLSMSKRLTTSQNMPNNREIIAALTQKIQALEDENKHLNDTVSWMHETIWDLIRKNKLLQRD
ncbi:teichuronopeptide [Clostridium sp. AM58-1XD]|uniref:teichuronopeptide n=1 Tax=Clostridium sp. AM58-1XD TaxID=2292307 RepID=UPI000E475432|nr:teichuronopeptide [Clostridium sp. AM58-1XD]RGY99275.1 teichuronopeptide [Clostridium sp. AM58-1XD]